MSFCHHKSKRLDLITGKLKALNALAIFKKQKDGFLNSKQ